MGASYSAPMYELVKDLDGAVQVRESRMGGGGRGRRRGGGGRTRRL